MNPTIVILTALSVELDAVLAYMPDAVLERHPDTGTEYYVQALSIPGIGLATVVVGRTNQTNVNSAAETERAIQRYRPRYLFYVGVAGGLKDVKVGDIVIGDDVIGLERAKIKERTFIRPQFGASSYELARSAYAYANSAVWNEKAWSLVDPAFQSVIRTYLGTIVSGEKVMANTEDVSFETIRTHASHALAIEMEGLGFLNTIRAYPQISSLLLRSISDLIDDKGESDSKGSQPYASKNIAAFLFGFLSSLTSEASSIYEDKSLRDKLFEVVAKIYPRGLDDNGIWQRAGGDLSLVALSSTGKAQWITALRLIEQGGGGNIRFEKLVAEMLVDYPGNNALMGILKSL